jgi:hypothetical protein
MSRKKFPDKLKAMRDAILPECVGEMDSLTAGIREVSLYLLKTLFHDNGDPRYRADREDPADGADEAKQKEGLQFTLEIENPRSLEAPHDSLTSLLDDLHPFINEAVPNPTARQGAVVHGGSIGPQVVPASCLLHETTLLPDTRRGHKASCARSCVTMALCTKLSPHQMILPKIPSSTR